MSEPVQPCVRGCVRPCPCPECKVADQPVHDPQIRPAKEGFLCGRCANNLRRWLGVVLEDTLRLDVRPPVDYAYDKTSKHSKISGSPALIRVDVAGLVDVRTNPTVGRMTQYYEENQQDIGYSIPSRVGSWALLLTEEMGMDSPVGTMAQAVSVLTAWLDTILGLLWVDDFYSDMQGIRQELDRAQGVERPKPMGNCFTCEQSLYSKPGEATIRCGRCGRRYDGLEQVRLEVQRRREAGA